MGWIKDDSIPSLPNVPPSPSDVNLFWLGLVPEPARYGISRGGDMQSVMEWSPKKFTL